MRASSPPQGPMNRMPHWLTAFATPHLHVKQRQRPCHLNETASDRDGYNHLRRVQSESRRQPVMISPALAAAFNQQIGNEFGASMQYVSIAAHFQRSQLTLLAKLF